MILGFIIYTLCQVVVIQLIMGVTRDFEPKWYDYAMVLIFCPALLICFIIDSLKGDDNE